MKPFIPAWMDDANLTPVQFRILCHLWRRSDASGVCWPSAPAIAAACRINRDSVWPALDVLAERGLIERERGARNANRYTVRVGGKEGPTDSDESAESNGRQSAEMEGLHPAEKRGRQSAEKRGRKGVPKKVTHKRVSKEGAARAPKLSDETFIESLKANEAFAGINIEHEIGKMRAWLLTKPGRHLTRPFIVNWLNRCDRPLTTSTLPAATLSLGRRVRPGSGYGEDTTID